jgi:hypothetical protein
LSALLSSGTNAMPAAMAFPGPERKFLTFEDDFTFVFVSTKNGAEQAQFSLPPPGRRNPAISPLLYIKVDAAIQPVV